MGGSTLSAHGFFVIHGELAVWGEEIGVVVMDVVVFRDETLDSWVGDGIW